MADQAEQKKSEYAELAATHHFVPVAIETMGVFGKEAQAFFLELGRRIQEETVETLSFNYLLQWIAVAMQRECSYSTGHHPHLATLTQYSSDKQHFHLYQAIPLL